MMQGHQPSLFWFHQAVDTSVECLLYKPPVGLVCITVLWQWTHSRSSPQQLDSPQQQQNHNNEHHMHTCLYQLDALDSSKRGGGEGVLSVRRQLLLGALEHLMAVEAQKSTPEGESIQEAEAEAEAEAAETETKESVLLSLLVQSLSNHGMSPKQHILNSWNALTRYEQESAQVHQSHATSNDQDLVLYLAYWTAQVRTLDTLLRLLRDRLLDKTRQLATDLERLETHQSTNSWWYNHNSNNNNKTGELRRLFHTANVQAAYRTELARLGAIVSFLTMETPLDWDENLLVQALERTDDNDDDKWSGWKDWFRTSFIWKKRDEPAMHSNLDGAHVIQFILRDSKAMGEWNETARQWSQDATTLVGRILEETVQQSFVSSEFTLPELNALLQSLGFDASDPSVATDKRTLLARLLAFVEHVATSRRLGEGPRKRSSLENLLSPDRLRQLNWHGIPSSLLKIAGAWAVHAWVAPHWKDIQRYIITASHKMVQIAQARVWEPVRGIWDDLMDHNAGIFSALNLDVEERSLDHLLRDLGLGDGTPATRNQALEQAADQYERKVSSNMFVHTIQGTLPRLLLLQMQHLKVGMLDSLQNIEVLMKGNRIHFQLLAAIPAVLMVTYGTRLGLRFLYNFKAHDVRSLTSVHRDMGRYLSVAEQRLRQAQDIERGDTSSSLASLNHESYGELVLLIHRYLIRLDYAQGIFSKSECARIRILLQHVLKPIAMNRALLWLQSAQEKHLQLLH